MHILGLSCFYHDAAAVLLRDGEIVAAAQEERFTREKADAGFPSRAIDYCLGHEGIAPSDLGAVIFYDKPLLKFERIIDTFLSTSPSGLGTFLKAVPVWVQRKLWMRRVIRKGLRGYKGRILFGEHHESHAASAFFPSPFEEAAIVTMDGVGEWATSSYGVGQKPDSMCGNVLPSLALRGLHRLPVQGQRQYKVMGLAPYGNPSTGTSSSSASSTSRRMARCA
jgi:carbamoyltransferase